MWQRLNTPFILANRSAASISSPSTPAWNGWTRAMPRMRQKATASGWPSWWQLAASAPRVTARHHLKKTPGPKPKFRSLGDELQTDETFDEDMVERMGTAFHSKVFAPAVEDAK